MKFGYASIKEKIIENYKIENDSLIINYLDGSVKKCSKEEEHNIINIMITQAYKRDEEISIKDLKKKNFTTFSYALIFLVISCVNISNVYYLTNNELKTINSYLGALLLILSISEFFNFKYRSEDISELKKYKIYLELIKNNENIKLLDEEYNLNINTIDEFDLKEIKKLIKKIK